MSKIDDFVMSMTAGSPMKKPSGSGKGVLKRPASAMAAAATPTTEPEELPTEEETENTQRIKARYVNRKLGNFSQLFQEFWKNSNQSERKGILRDGVKKDGRNYYLAEEPHLRIPLVCLPTNLRKHPQPKVLDL